MATNAGVIVKHNNVDFALRTLKSKLKDANVMKYYEEHLYYEKPSEKKRRRRQQAKRRAQYESQENNS